VGDDKTRRRGAVEAPLLRVGPPRPSPLGDLIATVNDPVMVEMQAAGWRDDLADLPVCGPGAATTHSFSGSVDGPRIDHILIPCTWTALARRSFESGL
jgi:hypothetical protein